MTELITVARELYALVPAEFVRARNDQATRIKAAGDDELAAAVKALPKPSTPAWVVNMMVRRLGEEVGQLLDLGAALRQAQEDLDGPQLRELDTQRRRLVAAIVRQGRALAADLGHRVTDAVATQVEATLHAAMADEGAEAALRTGLLVSPMTATGLGPADLTDVVAVPTAPEPPAPARRQPADLSAARRTRALARARKEAEAAATAATRARRRLHDAEDRLERLAERGTELRAELDELRRRLEETERDVERVERERAGAGEERDVADAAYEDARETAEAARAELARLRDEQA